MLRASLNKNVVRKIDPDYWLFPGVVKFDFQIFYHPYVCEFIRALNRFGTDGLLTWMRQTNGAASIQLLKDDKFFATEYGPNPQYVYLPGPVENVDFSPDGAYSQYNWELFFHAPLLIANRLSQNQQFEDAQRWFHSIFDPTSAGPPGSGIERYWKMAEFWRRAQQKIEDELQGLLTDPAQANELSKEVADWRLYPFEPHRIARHRKWAYPKTVVRKYLDNLIAWGDQLFRQDTLEAINEATLLYVLAADILGPRPPDIPARVEPKVMTYNDLEPKLNAFSDALVASENVLFGMDTAGDGGNGDGASGGSALPDTLYFCIPKNDVLLGYWDTVADRLFKIRHCMNIEGAIRQLPLFEPPINPALLVAGAAAGVDLASALAELNAAVPNYRFGPSLLKAVELAGDVRALGASLLSAIEKRDAETLALLRSGQEVDLLTAVRQVKQLQVDEAQAALDALNRQQEMIQARIDYYRNIQFLNTAEKLHLALAAGSLVPQFGQLGLELGAGVMNLIPEFDIGVSGLAGTPVAKIKWGGGNLAGAVQAFASSLGITSAIMNTVASLAATMGGYQRRADEWNLQKELATRELAQVKKLTDAATVRLNIGQVDLDNHQRQIDNAKAVDEFMRTKFTNVELFDWMVAQTSAVYFQTYQLAYDMAKRAERAYQFERAEYDASFVKPGYWDSLRKGLLAGERLQYDLKRMEAANLDRNKREFEITKHVSLALLAPDALVMLREHGQCFVDLPEAMFDLDYPGHYLRRLKSVSLTIPCTVGPYTSLNCTLTLVSNKVRVNNDAANAIFKEQVGAVHAIATSSGQNDGGVFELDFRDERYLPFENAGAISTWRLQLPRETNLFDFETISDVILHVRYTARDGGEIFRKAILESVVNFTINQPRLGLRLFSAKHEFPEDWHRFLNPPDTATAETFTFALAAERFPYVPGKNDLKLTKIELFLVVKDLAGYANDTALAATLTQNGSSTPLTFQAPALPIPDQPTGLVQVVPYAAAPSSGSVEWDLPGWSLAVNVSAIPKTLKRIVNGQTRIDPNALEDIGILCHYEVKPKP